MVNPKFGHRIRGNMCERYSSGAWNKKMDCFTSIGTSMDNPPPDSQRNRW